MANNKRYLILFLTFCIVISPFIYALDMGHGWSQGFGATLLLVSIIFLILVQQDILKIK